ncbi:MAG: hypothetical protein JWO87_3689, partial [Phycisphaerales bacterium]|nr:hypothetical protein [Phycisphaerales bacterium]
MARRSTRSDDEAGLFPQEPAGKNGEGPLYQIPPG